MPDFRERLQTALSGRYAIDRELGGGGLSRVFVADEIALGRRVVIKVLPPELSSVVGGERFRREVEVAARLQHPNIVPLLSTGDADGMPFFTMPFVEGETLRARLLAEPRQSIAEVVRVMREAADALGYAHERGVVHRDVKPENILISGGHACIADFGIAKALSAATDSGSVTSVGIALGTPAYMAPEQAAADPATDHRADLYALGVIAYEMLAGQPPFPGRAGAQLLAAHASQAPRPIAQLRPECPSALTTLVTRCLEKSPDSRPRNAQEIVGSLDAMQTPIDTLATEVRHRRSKKGIVAAGVAAGMILLAGGAVAFTPRETRATALTLLTRRTATLVPTRVLVAPFDNRSGDTTLDALGAMTADWIGQGLSRVPGMEVVDPRTALASREVVDRIPWPLRSRDQARAMAQEVGAGTLVSGAYYREGDTLRFQAQISDVDKGRLIRALAAVSGTRAAPSHILSELQRRVAASLALASDTTAGTLVASFAEPPSLEAYQEVYRGIEAYFRGEDSSEYAHLERAAALDTTYTTPLVFLAFAHAYNYDYGIADSVVRRAERLTDRLAPAERAMLDHVEAVVRGDPTAAIRSAQRFASLMPGSQESPLLLASIALSTLRPRLALSALARVDPDRGLNLAGPFYWIYQSEAAAQLGDWRRSLAMARAGMRRFPEAGSMHFMVARAMARLGQVGDIEEVIASTPARRHSLARQAQMAAGIWGELRASGQHDAADRLVRRYAGLLDAAQSDTDRDTRYARGRILWRAGRVPEAKAIFSALAARDTGDNRLRDLAQLGIVDAKLGDRDDASHVERELSAFRPQYDRGVPVLLQAEVAAARGDRERAVVLLRQGLGMGMGMTELGESLVGNEDLEPLYGYPAFDQLLQPQG